MTRIESEIHDLYEFLVLNDGMADHDTYHTIIGISNDVAEVEDENAKLREQLGRLQPIDCEGNDIDIADKVHMLRSEYDGDHEWDDVVVELALTKWGGDRWIVRGSKGEAWAYDCVRTGYDEDMYENSDNAELVENPTLIEVENAKLRELVADMHTAFFRLDIDHCQACPRDTINGPCTMYIVGGSDECHFEKTMRELGIELDG